VAESPRDEFSNSFVGDLVHTERGWVVVPPTCCPDGHAYTDPGWSVSSVWCTCNGRQMAWRCPRGKSIFAPQPGVDCESGIVARSHCGKTNNATTRRREPDRRFKSTLTAATTSRGHP
jgi:hypothetical protein